MDKVLPVPINGQFKIITGIYNFLALWAKVSQKDTDIVSKDDKLYGQGLLFRA